MNSKFKKKMETGEKRMGEETEAFSNLKESLYVHQYVFQLSIGLVKCILSVPVFLLFLALHC